MQAWFLSDLHLKDSKERSSEILLRFLHSLIREERPATHLFLLGDIFDVWVADHKIFKKKWEPILTALKTLSLRGIKIIYSEGNHDMHLGSYWKKHFDADVFTKPSKMKIGPYWVRFEHGDFINPDDKSYLVLRSILRSLPVKILAHSLPGSFWNDLGDQWSTTSRKKSQVYKREVLEAIRSRIHTYAQVVREKDEFDYLVTGHVHLRDRFEFSSNGKKTVSVNLGSWFDKATVFGLSDDGEQVLVLE